MAEKSGAFKVQIQTAVVQIDGSHHRLLVIGHETFRMEKSRLKLVNLYPCLQKFRVKGLCHCKSIGFVRDARHKDLYVYPSPGRIGKSRDHLIIQDQIWRHNMYISFCIIKEIHINRLSGAILIQETVTIRDY